MCIHIHVFLQPEVDERDTLPKSSKTKKKTRKPVKLNYT